MLAIVGLGDVGDDIKGALQTIRDKVDEGIDWVIDKALPVVEAVAGAVQSIVGAIKNVLFPPKKFTTDEEDHTISAEPVGGTNEIFVQSARLSMFQVLDYLSEKSPKKEGARIDKLRTSYTTWRDSPEKEDDEKKKKQDAYKAIADELADLWKALDKDDVPDSVIGWGGMDQGRATSVDAKLTRKGPPGSDASGDVKGSDTGFELGKDRKKVAWSKTHLLHRDLGGPGESFNLTPTSSSVNQLMYHAFEEKALQALKRGKFAKGKKSKRQLHYNVEVKYEAPYDFAKTVTGSVEEIGTPDPPEDALNIPKTPFDNY